MNILFLSTENPYPPDHGHHIRTYNVLKYLSQENNIYFIGFAKNSNELKYNKQLGQFCKSVDMFMLSGGRNKLYLILFLFLNLFSLKPFAVKRYYKKEAKNKIVQILKENDIDLIHFDMLHLGMYCNYVNSVPKILVNHNVESLRLIRLLRVQKNIFVKLYLYIQYLKLVHFEKKTCPKFDKCIVVSDADKKVLTEMCVKNNFEIVPNGVDIKYFKPNNSNVKTKSLVWTGGMGGLYNKDAVDCFLDNIFPIIKARIPDVKVTFVGSSPTSKLIKTAQNSPGIEITGYVDDVRPYMNESSVFIAPLRSGSGTKIKVLNALALEKAVVTTSIGAEGINVEHKKNVIISDETKEFAEQTIYLLENPQIAKKIGENGRKFIEDNYAWEIIFNKMNHIYEEL
jgi:polysaccharide biosynthesis protein PslH